MFYIILQGRRAKFLSESDILSDCHTKLDKFIFYVYTE